MTQEREEQGGWSTYGDPRPSPEEQTAQEETGWEVYDELAWERAKEQETGKVTLKIPALMKGEGNSRRAIDSDMIKEEDLARQSGELVRAVKGYKAILSGNYLTYEKDDVMKVLYRDSDGLLTVLRPTEIYFTDL